VPLAGSGGPRGRVTPAAQLPLGVAGEREVVDIVLLAKLRLAEVRDAVEALLPPPMALIDLHDVWLGAPAAPAAVVAADYRIEIGGVDVAWLTAAAAALVAAPTLPRQRRREKSPGDYDLRPLILDLAAAVPAAGAVPGSTAVLRVRLRHSTDAVGRTDEVVAALREAPAPPLPAALEVLAVVRERLVMGDDVEDAARAM
jgi:hypothetical protein